MLAQYPQMLLSPFAQYGDKSEIPAITEQGTNAFSYYSGFPTITGQPLSVGGLPPSREDFNAFANMLSQVAFYWQCGGQVEYSEQIDYPINARVYANNVEYLCLKENGAGTENGVQDLANIEYWQAQEVISPYVVGEIKQFLLENPPEGFLVLNGAIIENASVTVPNLWEYLQSKEGLAFCVSEEEWQEQSNAVYYKNSSGTEYSWEGIGGVCAYVIDIETNSIRLPDLRGMYAENAGFDSLEVGDVHNDTIRNISGTMSVYQNAEYRLGVSGTGAFVGANSTSVRSISNSGSHTNASYLNFSASNVVPTGNKVAPRAYGVLACVYVGIYNI